MNVYMDSLARSLARRGTSVVVFAGDRTGRRRVVESEPGYRIEHIPIYTGPDDRPTARSLSSYLRHVEYRVRADVVHAHYWLSGLAGLSLQERLGIPLVTTFHSRTVLEPGVWNSRNLDRRAAAETKLARQSAQLVVSTVREAATIASQAGIGRSRISTVRPGVEHESFRPGSRAEARRCLNLGPEPVLLFAGRVQPQKGLVTAVEAVLAVRRAHPGTRLVVVGGPSGPRGSQELRSAVSLAETDRGAVRFEGPVAHSRMVLYYRAADVMVVPSRSESFGLAAAEAQACGLPVVGARVDGLRSFVGDGQSGILIDGYEPSAYAAAIVRLIGSVGLRRRMAEEAQAATAPMAWAEAAERVSDAYRAVIDEHRADDRLAG